MTCPFRDQCPQACLGDEGDKQYEPHEGFIPVIGGILCLDWDVLLPMSEQQVGEEFKQNRLSRIKFT